VQGSKPYVGKKVFSKNIDDFEKLPALYCKKILVGWLHGEGVVGHFITAQ